MERRRAAEVGVNRTVVNTQLKLLMWAGLPGALEEKASLDP